jgi:hypothetical protein
VLAFSQKTAWGLLMSATSALPNPSFVGARSPDTGNSIRGDGSDYGPLWNGQTLLDAWHLTGSLLPGGSAVAEGLLANFLATQDNQGAVDCKPGLGGQRGRFLAPPMLAALAWRIYLCTGDIDFLKDAFPRLIRFVTLWFSSLHDRDGDGFPEWEHPFQTGFEDNPAFDRLHPWGQGLEISLVENPGLGAYLAREVHTLDLIAHVIGMPNQVNTLKSKAEAVQKMVEATWDGRRG